MRERRGADLAAVPVLLATQPGVVVSAVTRCAPVIAPAAAATSVLALPEARGTCLLLLFFGLTAAAAALSARVFALTGFLTVVSVIWASTIVQSPLQTLSTSLLAMALTALAATLGRPAARMRQHYAHRVVAEQSELARVAAAAGPRPTGPMAGGSAGASRSRSGEPRRRIDQSQRASR